MTMRTFVILIVVNFYFHSTVSVQITYIFTKQCCNRFDSFGTDYNYMYIMCFYLNTNWFEWTAVLVPSSSNENEIIIFMTIEY